MRVLFRPFPKGVVLKMHSQASPAWGDTPEVAPFAVQIGAVQSVPLAWVVVVTSSAAEHKRDNPAKTNAAAPNRANQQTGSIGGLWIIWRWF
jgi:hypothetical protein